MSTTTLCESCKARNVILNDLGVEGPPPVCPVCLMATKVEELENLLHESTPYRIVEGAVLRDPNTGINLAVNTLAATHWQISSIAAAASGSDGETTTDVVVLMVNDTYELDDYRATATRLEQANQMLQSLKTAIPVAEG